MKTHFSTDGYLSQQLPATYAGDDIRLPEDVIEFFVRAYTDMGDGVFDPFAGFGTTLLVSQRMNRVPFGIEIDRERVEYFMERLSNPDLIQHGDSRELKEMSIPSCKLSISSPPYMNKWDVEDPLSGESKADGKYAAYIDQLAHVYADVANTLSAHGRLVVQVQNLRNDHGVTPLAWDLHARLSERLSFDGEVVVTQPAALYGYDHSYCLVYQPATSKQQRPGSATAMSGRP